VTSTIIAGQGRRHEAARKLPQYGAFCRLDEIAALKVAAPDGWCSTQSRHRRRHID
jgi:hypothetical protein